MNKKQEHYRKNLLAKIHMHNKYKELFSNGAWEDYLFVRYGVFSSRHLSISELLELLASLNGEIEKIAQTIDWRGREILCEDITSRQVDKIKELSEELDMNEGQLFYFIKKQTGELYCTLLALSKKEASKVITGLKKVLEWRS